MDLLTVDVSSQIHDIVKNIFWGNAISKVETKTSFGVVTSVITTRSIKELSIDIVTEVLALTKASVVAIASLKN